MITKFKIFEFLQLDKSYDYLSMNENEFKFTADDGDYFDRKILEHHEDIDPYGEEIWDKPLTLEEIIRKEGYCKCFIPQTRARFGGRTRCDVCGKYEKLED